MLFQVEDVRMCQGHLSDYSTASQEQSPVDYNFSWKDVCVEVNKAMTKLCIEHAYLAILTVGTTCSPRLRASGCGCERVTPATPGFRFRRT